MIEERIDELIDKYKKLIDTYVINIESHKKSLVEGAYSNLYVPITYIAQEIEETGVEIDLFESFIKDLEYAKTGEINKEDEDD